MWLRGMVTQYALSGHVFCSVEATSSQFLVDVRVRSGMELKWGCYAPRKNRTEKYLHDQLWHWKVRKFL